MRRVKLCNGNSGTMDQESGGRHAQAIGGPLAATALGWHQRCCHWCCCCCRQSRLTDHTQSLAGQARGAALVWPAAEVNAVYPNLRDHISYAGCPLVDGHRNAWSSMYLGQIREERLHTADEHVVAMHISADGKGIKGCMRECRNLELVRDERRPRTQKERKAGKEVGRETSQSDGSAAVVADIRRARRDEAMWVLTTCVNENSACSKCTLSRITL